MPSVICLLQATWTPKRRRRHATLTGRYGAQPVQALRAPRTAAVNTTPPPADATNENGHYGYTQLAHVACLSLKIFLEIALCFRNNAFCQYFSRDLLEMPLRVRGRGRLWETTSLAMSMPSTTSANANQRQRQCLLPPCSPGTTGSTRTHTSMPMPVPIPMPIHPGHAVSCESWHGTYSSRWPSATDSDTMLPHNIRS